MYFAIGRIIEESVVTLQNSMPPSEEPLVIYILCSWPFQPSSSQFSGTVSSEPRLSFARAEEGPAVALARLVGGLLAGAGAGAAVFGGCDAATTDLQSAEAAAGRARLAACVEAVGR